MKNWTRAALLLALTLLIHPAKAQTILGTGDDFSYLVIEAAAYGSPLVYEWHYTYNPASPFSTYDMMVAVQTLQPDLSFGTLFGGTYLDAITFEGLTLTNTAVAPYSPFWAQWVSGGESGNPLQPMPDGVWSEGYGIADRTLAPGSWDGFIFNGEFNQDPPYNITSPPPSIAPVPEPGTVVLVIAGGAAAAFLRRRVRQNRG